MASNFIITCILLSTYSPLNFCMPAAFPVASTEFKDLTNEVWEIELQNNAGVEIDLFTGRKTLQNFITREPDSRFLSSYGASLFTDLLDFFNDSKASIFMDHFMNTALCSKVQKFLSKKGMNEKEVRKIFWDLWFETFSRTSQRSRSSGFAHVFQGEKESGQVHGLHNWLQFYMEAKKDKIQHIKLIEATALSTPSRKYFVKMAFTWNGRQKSMSSMLFGTTPEYELVIYTLCAYMFPNSECTVSCGPLEIIVKSFIFAKEGSDLIRTSYPLSIRRSY